MADTQKIAVRAREITGKKVSRLRREGVLPGVVFGLHRDSANVQTDLREFERGYRRWGNTTLVTLEGLADGEQPVLIHDVTRSTLTGQLLHVDFLRVSLTEKVHAEVPIHFVGESPAVKGGGGVLVHAKSQINVEAFPQDIPHAIEVDLAKLLEIDDSIYVRDLTVDTSKVEVQDDGDELVVRVVPVRVEEEAPAPAAAAAEGEEGAEGAEPAEGEAAAPAAGAAPKPGAAAPKPGAAPAAGAKPAAAAPAKGGGEKKG